MDNRENEETNLAASGEREIATTGSKYFHSKTTLLNSNPFSYPTCKYPRNLIRNI